jgi:hypothetical protein
MTLLVPFSRVYASLRRNPMAYAAFVNRSIVGRPRHQGVMVGMGQKDSYVGSVAALPCASRNFSFANI